VSVGSQFAELENAHFARWQPSVRAMLSFKTSQGEKHEEDYCQDRRGYPVLGCKQCCAGAGRRGYDTGADVLAQPLRDAVSAHRKPDEERALSSKTVKIHHKEKNMKKTIVRIVVTSLLLLALGSTTAVADGTPMPMCWPNPCATQ
jgi:hypothetical protein